jgi:plasmid replication initiation protein
MPKRKSYELALNDWVERSTGLVDILRGFSLTLTQMDFMYLYLSKIDASNPETKSVVFTLDEYLKIADIKEVNEVRIDEYIQSLLGKSYKAKLEEQNKKGKEYIPLFSHFQFYKNNEDEWFISAVCHEKSTDLFFDLAEEIKYTRFQLWNVLGLKSQNYRRMYEILKQYQKIGFRDFSIDELKKELWIDGQYTRWQDFKVYVIEKCKTALEENTDIRFAWEILKKKGKSPVRLRFNIFKNKPTKRGNIQEVMEEYHYHEEKRQVEIEIKEESDELIRLQRELQEKAIEVEYEEVPEATADGSPLRYQERIALLSKALDNKFTPDEVETFANQVKSHNEGIFNDDKSCAAYMKAAYEYTIDKAISEVASEGFKNYLKKALSNNYARYVKDATSTDSSDKFSNSPSLEEMGRMEKLLTRLKADGEERP